jgi:phthalate 4,5-dioxygenase
MLSRKDNVLLTQTGPDTPMGRMLREYWWPVLRADKLERDGPPEKVRLLSENYVAFRDTEGRLGFLDEYCPHRRVSLTLARNEKCGLRCIMHGWKIDVHGKVLETPNEVVAGSRLERLKVRHFPIREEGGMIWVFVGNKEAPPFPNFAFNNAVEIQPLICTIDCNWIQVMETLWDPAHVMILHGQDTTFNKTWESVEGATQSFAKMGMAMSDGKLRDEPWGFQYMFAAQGGGWVPTVMPCWVFISNPDQTAASDRVVFAHTPVDDEHMLMWEIPYNISHPLGDTGKVLASAVGEAKHNFRLETMIPEQRWGQDRAGMAANQSFTGLGIDRGVVGLLNQDVAVGESMGAISSREFENLGPADLAVAKGRQVLLKAMRTYEATGKALGTHADVSLVGTHAGQEAARREEPQEAAAQH